LTGKNRLFPFVVSREPVERSKHERGEFCFRTDHWTKETIVVERARDGIFPQESEKGNDGKSTPW
jgi:hypothetical protein